MASPTRPLHALLLLAAAATAGRVKGPIFSRARAGAGFKVCISGGAGGIGQPLSLLMALDPLVNEVAIQDLTLAAVPVGGVAADLNHMEVSAQVKGYATDPSNASVEQLEPFLTGCQLVLVPAGLPRKPGMTRDDLFNANADIARGLVAATARYCPEAIIGLIVNPVNSVVPAMAELYKKKGLDPLKILGVTTLDSVRANKFVAEVTGKPPAQVQVTVVGGHAGKTIIPLFSQDRVASTLPAGKLEELDVRTQDGGTEVVTAKKGKGSATLSMAYAGSKFGGAVLRGLSGTKTTISTYLSSSVTELPYFASKVTFGPGGVEKIHPIGPMSAHEQRRLDEAMPQLAGEIKKGLEYASENSI